MMFTNLLVNLTKNAFVILGILVAMLCLNYALTRYGALLCSLHRHLHYHLQASAALQVKDATTDINTYLSETFPVPRLPRFLAARTKRWRSSTKKPDPFQGHAGTDFVFAYPPAGLHAVHQLYFVPVLPGRHGPPENVSFLGQTITGGTIVTFYMYISKFFTPIQNLAEQFNWLQSALASSEKVFSIMDIQPKLVDAPDAIELTDVKGEIEFRDVWFSYIPGEWVLQGVSFHVSPRETVAFVGSTGSGKSTILSSSAAITSSRRAKF